MSKELSLYNHKEEIVLHVEKLEKDQFRIIGDEHSALGHVEDVVTRKELNHFKDVYNLLSWQELGQMKLF